MPQERAVEWSQTSDIFTDERDVEEPVKGDHGVRPGRSGELRN